MARSTMYEIMSGVTDIRGKPKRIANNTVRYTRGSDGATIIRLHRTNVVTKLVNGDVILHSNGWRTVTTKARMNEHLSGYVLYQKKHEWYVVKHTGEGYDWKNPIEYYDGMVLSASE